MSPLNEMQRLIHDAVVAPALKERVHDIRALVTKYDDVKNIASVSFPSIHGEGYTELDNVPVQIGSAGFHSAGPFVGDEVWISFIGGSMLMPQIVSLADRQYKLRTREYRLKHEKQGAYLPDNIISRN